jgi:hypothetical protein
MAIKNEAARWREHLFKGHAMNTSPDLTPVPQARRLRLTPHYFAACIAVLALGWPTLGLADCVDTRKASAAEIDFHKKAMATLLAALPPAPVGGSLQYKDNVTSLGQQCGPTGDFTAQASRAYEHNYRKSIVSMAINVQRLPAAAGPLSAAYGTASPGRSAGLKVHNVVWTVSGSDSPLRQALVDAIDRARLEALVGKPLPSVAESDALAARAVPPTVGATGGTGAGSTATSGPAPGMQTGAQPSVATDSSMPAAAGQTVGSEPLKGAADAVNKLRGLFGR